MKDFNLSRFLITLGKLGKDFAALEREKSKILLIVKTSSHNYLFNLLIIPTIIDNIKAEKHYHSNMQQASRIH